MTADEVMQQFHRDCRDGGLTQKAAALGACGALHLAGLLSDSESRLWEKALQVCPGHDDEGGRVWCAYCGDLPTVSELDEHK